MVRISNLPQKLFLLYSLCLLRSVIIPCCFLLIRYNLDPDYTSANCLMKLVNQTAPTHFQNHIFYNGVNFDNRCDIEKYVEAQFDHNEYSYLNVFFALLASSGILAAALDWKNVNSVKIVGSLLAGYHLSQVHHVFSHFGQDISFFAGNIIHHADISNFTDKSNASLVDTIPQGFAVTIIVSIIWACVVRALIPNFDPFIGKFISWKSLYCCNVLFGFVVALQVKRDHPWLHEHAKVDMVNSAPFTWDMTAYRHVYGHHTTGEWLGPHFLLDPIFSVFMKLYAYLHNEVLHLHLDSAGHFVVATVYDSIVSFMVVVLIWGVLRCAAWFQMFLINNFLPPSVETSACHNKLD